LLTQLTRLDFEDTDLTGSNPTHFGELVKLEYVDLNDIFDAPSLIPSELGLLTMLTRLDTGMTGTIPAAICSTSPNTEINLADGALTLPSDTSECFQDD
jgi:hypothetical protein